jgi:hypothetical protein
LTRNISVTESHKNAIKLSEGRLDSLEQFSMDTQAI